MLIKNENQANSTTIMNFFSVCCHALSIDGDAIALVPTRIKISPQGVEPIEFKIGLYPVNLSDIARKLSLKKNSSSILLLSGCRNKLRFSEKEDYSLESANADLYRLLNVGEGHIFRGALPEEEDLSIGISLLR